MRWRPLIWLAVGLLFIAVLWRLSFARHSRHLVIQEPSAIHAFSENTTFTPADSSSRTKPVFDRKFPYRLSNTTEGIRELAHKPKAILLANAFLNTSGPLPAMVPFALRAQADPGSFIVQSRLPLTGSFQSLLYASGATVIAYIPNNAYLVRASEGVAKTLAANNEVQAVIPYEPYYKLQTSLLPLALGHISPVSGSDTPNLLSLNVLLFADLAETTMAVVSSLVGEVLSKEDSPFGPQLAIRVPAEKLAALACLPGVQEIELTARRVTANDLSRAAIGVAFDSTTPSNYIGLTGTNIVVNINDTGVDSNYPGLANRVVVDRPTSGQDTNGHGTQVAGIIAGDGYRSLTVTNASGSILPAVDFQFRGQAPAASIFTIAVDLDSGSSTTDTYLQQTAAQAKAFISNNSWHYAGANGYDLAAASYDAAVRDALPALPGSQPVLYVFAAGNSGGGAGDGTGGNPDTIQSPATAKNVITVGALEQLRRISNETWTCTGGGGTCQTNSPWLALTDSSNQVAAFSSRGNVGVGTEAEYGRFKPDVVAPGTFVVSARSTQWDQSSYYSQTNNALVPLPDANYSESLSNLNNGLGPFYRFESGTSLAAANVSGALALIQEFFEQRLGQTNSPALMKALLINGARSLTNLYGLSPRMVTNAQGWGLIRLPNSLPTGLTNLGASRPMLLFDQTPADALSTGQSRTRFVSLSSGATNQALGVTLVWTDPPGNPVAATKLVNDLDLIVTNLDTGAVFLGNDIQPGSSFSSPWNPSGSGTRDCINNVENVILKPGLSAHYSVTVVGKRIGVNAVTQHTNGIVQDYALVICSGNGEIADALTMTQDLTNGSSGALVTMITNAFASDSGDFGNILTHQYAGAGLPLLATNTIPLPGFSGANLTIGNLEQWHFYVFTNTAAYTNVAFLTFLSTETAVSTPPLDGQARDADVDLYVSTDPGLTNLDPAVLAKADYSVGRGGDEMILYSNALPGTFYIGVKSESQNAADYGFVAIASDVPFAQVDPLGNELLRGFSVPVLIPNGEGTQTGKSYLFGICPDSIPVRRVIVTNTLTSFSLPDLQCVLEHNGSWAVLRNHSGSGMVDHASFIYEDSAEKDIVGTQFSDGPGNLLAFAGLEGFGQWRLDLSSTNQVGTANGFWVFLERQQDLSGSVSVSILPGACREDFINLPATTTNLTGIISFSSGTGPLSMQVCRIDDPLDTCLQVPVSTQGTNAVVMVDSTSQPPLNPGTYFIRVCNLGPDPAAANITAISSADATSPALQTFTSNPGPAPISDDALSISSIEVTNRERILAVEVGVRIDHPRISDLALRLVSPQGTGILLDQNRGGLSFGGMGCTAVTTSTVPITYNGGPEAVTNIVETGQTSGLIGIIYDFYEHPDDMRVYYDGNLLFDSGFVSNSNSVSLTYGPGLSTFFTIVMNQGGNPDSRTAWSYNVTSTHLIPIDLTFTEDTNLTSVPIKFAATPFTNFNYFGTGTRAGNGIFYLPEESLDKFAGEWANGTWRLEINDSRLGATNPPPKLVNWQLSLLFRDTVPQPIALRPGQPVTNLLGAGQIQWFVVDTPTWVSFATNTLLSSTAPVNLLFNQLTPPTGTNAGDSTLLAGTSSGASVLRTNGSPAFIPGKGFYLGVQNTNDTSLGFVFGVDFDIASLVTLQNGVPYAGDPSPANALDHYRYTVSTNALRAQFEINGPTGDVTLLARRGPTPASPTAYDYLSANPGTNDELIVVYDYSRPVPLSAGDWFLTVVNLSAAPVTYSVMATESPAYGTNILITDSSVSSNVFCISWSSLPGAHYYLQGKNEIDDTNWVTISPTLTASDLITSYCVPLTAPLNFFRIEEGLVITPPPLVIGSVSYNSTGVLLRWQAPTNQQFQVEWTASIDLPHWSAFTNVITSSSDSFSFLDDGSQSGSFTQTRYYRLRRWP